MIVQAVLYHSSYQQEDVFHNALQDNSYKVDLALDVMLVAQHAMDLLQQIVYHAHYK